MTLQQAPLEATLARFDGSAAILRYADGREVRVNVSAAAQEALAREVLNQLLSER